MTRQPHGTRRQGAWARAALLALGLLACAAGKADPTRPRSGQEPVLRVATFGGSIQEAQQTAMFKPFADDTGAHLAVSGWSGALRVLQTRAATGAEDWTLLLMEASSVQVACKQGLLLAAPLARDPAGDAPDRPGTGCGVPAWRMNLVLAWDRGRVGVTPTWNDFWNVAQHPGKRGLRHDPRGTLEIALMADGVAPGDVYRALSTTDGVDRAFRELDQLKPYIVWWNTPEQAVQIIESGAVLMSSAPAGEIAAADRVGHRDIGAQWSQSLGIALDWAIPRAAPSQGRGRAQRLLGFVSDPARQAAFSAAYPSPPPADAAPRQATLKMDDSFWSGHLVALQSRFDRWAESK